MRKGELALSFKAGTARKGPQRVGNLGKEWKKRDPWNNGMSKWQGKKRWRALKIWKIKGFWLFRTQSKEGRGLESMMKSLKNKELSPQIHRRKRRKSLREAKGERREDRRRRELQRQKGRKGDRKGTLSRGPSL